MKNQPTDLLVICASSLNLTLRIGLAFHVSDTGSILVPTFARRAKFTDPIQVFWRCYDSVKCVFDLLALAGQRLEPALLASPS
jgi:hypothetical protein